MSEIPKPTGKEKVDAKLEHLAKHLCQLEDTPDAPRVFNQLLDSWFAENGSDLAHAIGEHIEEFQNESNKS